MDNQDREVFTPEQAAAYLLLLWATRTHPDVTLREYSQAEIEGFLNEDKLDDEALSIARRYLRSRPRVAYTGDTECRTSGKGQINGHA